jgi:hypothetical protein
MDPRSYDVPGAIAVNVLFVALLVIGTAFRSVRLRNTALLVLFWAAGYAGLPYVPAGGIVYRPFLFVTYVAVLDIVAVGLMFRGLDRLE